MVIGRTAGGQGPWKLGDNHSQPLPCWRREGEVGVGEDMQQGGRANSRTLSSQLSLHGLGVASRRQVEEAGVKFFGTCLTYRAN